MRQLEDTSCRAWSRFWRRPSSSFSRQEARLDMCCACAVHTWKCGCSVLFFSRDLSSIWNGLWSTRELDPARDGFTNVAGLRLDHVMTNLGVTLTDEVVDVGSRGDRGNYAVWRSVHSRCYVVASDEYLPSLFTLGTWTSFFGHVLVGEIIMIFLLVFSAAGRQHGALFFTVRDRLSGDLCSRADGSRIRVWTRRALVTCICTLDFWSRA